jgi:hypothetical protein
MKILAADSMELNTLKKHREAVHVECVGTTHEFLYTKLNEFND